MKHEKFGLISIIMAAYNAERTIEQAIGSVLNQTYSNFELLVINDCSRDKTTQIVESITKRDGRVRLILNEKNSGVSYTRKHGLEEAKGEWIAILDSDDAWAPEKLEKQIMLQEQTNADLLFTGSAFMDADGEPINWYFEVPAEVTYRQLLKQNVLSNSSALVRKELYAKHYATNDGMHEDFAIWLSILKEGKKAYGVNEPLLIYRITKSSKSGNKVKAAIMNWNTYRYVGLNVAETIYYEAWYMVKNVIKYTNLNIISKRTTNVYGGGGRLKLYLPCSSAFRVSRVKNWRWLHDGLCIFCTDVGIQQRETRVFEAGNRKHSVADLSNRRLCAGV